MPSPVHLSTEEPQPRNLVVKFLMIFAYGRELNYALWGVQQLDSIVNPRDYCDVVVGGCTLARLLRVKEHPCGAFAVLQLTLYSASDCG